jgi:hypothetical protein
VIRIDPPYGLRFGGGKVFDGLIAYPVVLDPDMFLLFVVPHIGMGAEAVHGPVGRGDSPVGKEEAQLVEGFRGTGKKIPQKVRVPGIALEMAPAAVNELGPFNHVSGKKDRGIVPQEIIVSLPGVEFYREVPDVPPGIRRPPSALGDGKTDEDFGLFSRLGKKGRAGILRYGPDHLEHPVGPGLSGVDLLVNPFLAGEALPFGVANLPEQRNFFGAGRFRQPLVGNERGFHVFLIPAFFYFFRF